MPKRVKITLYVILVLAIIAVVRFILWNINTQPEEPIAIDAENLTWAEITNDDNWNTVDIVSETAKFEDDVMKDLEWFFNNNNWYEDVQWEFWFTSSVNE
jgi:hypothetical protein